MTPLEKFYTEDPGWHEKIGGIHALIERVKISEEHSGDVLHLRKRSRILSIHSSTAIEGNRLNLGQVTDIINGKPVWGPPEDIKEVQNAWNAYNEMTGYDPWTAGDLLRAHAHLTDALIGESGRFRTVGVAVVRGDGVVMHRGSPAEQVPALVEQLLYWGKTGEAHPLIKSSAVHYMLEYIHPFRDGNGRIGRLWQTLILSKWNPLFAWMPVETLIHHNQALYYQALQDSHAGTVDCRPFIDFMLDAISNSLYRYIDAATETALDVGENDGVNVGVNDQILELLRQEPRLTARELATLLNKTTRTIERRLKMLREQGRVQRVGSDKAGHWEIIERPS
ncbi:MAG: Fic family protein [Spirochaetes bacterium]|nr:MAG: Fic family protein [Spirochaetota bacterium]